MDFGREHDGLVLNRPLYLSPRQGALLGMVWIAIQKSREKDTGAVVETKVLGDLIFAAQDRGLIDRQVFFRPSDEYLRGWEVPELHRTLETLKNADLLHVPETGDTVGFMGTTFYDLPTWIFRHINVFRFAELVEEFTGGVRG